MLLVRKEGVFGIIADVVDMDRATVQGRTSRKVAAVDGKRLPLPVPKSGVALMAELDPEGAKRGAIAMEEDEARRAREREAEDSALDDGVTIVGSSSSSKKKKKREKATMSAAGGAADVGVESKVEL